MKLRSARDADSHGFFLLKGSNPELRNQNTERSDLQTTGDFEKCMKHFINDNIGFFINISKMGSFVSVGEVYLQMFFEKWKGKASKENGAFKIGIMGFFKRAIGFI